MGHHAVGADGHGRVVDPALGALAHTADHQAAVAGSLRLPLRDRRPFEGLGERLERLAVGRVPRHGHLRQHDDVGALLEEGRGRVDAGLPVGLGCSGTG